MYTYINDNFLHAPSTDLSRDTVKLLSQLMLAQAQECFLEQSIGLKKTPAFIAKLAAQAGWIYGNIVENMSDLISRNVFDRSWLTVCQVQHKILKGLFCIEIPSNLFLSSDKTKVFCVYCAISKIFGL
jgi:hypothetical protein